MSSYLVAAAVSFCSAWLVLFLMACFPHRLPLDRPNQRSLHAHPVPRTGGVGIMLGMLAAVFFLRVPDLHVLLGLTFALAVFSIIDDIKGLPVFARLLAHLAAAVSFVGIYAPLEIPVPALLAAVVALAWMANLYNFMDGSDGLAGGMAVFGFGAYGVAATVGGDAEIAALSVFVAAAALAFLWFNFAPARIFMGDGGSIPLGFAAAALGLVGYWRDVWPLAFPLLVFSPFIVDASLTLLRRGLAGEKVWQAHRSHYYQRLVRMGWSHRRLALAEYGLMAAAGASGLMLVVRPEWLLGLSLAWVAIYAGLAVLVDRRWKEAGLVH